VGKGCYYKSAIQCIVGTYPHRIPPTGGILGQETCYTTLMNRKKLLVFDMDDTLLAGNMWEPFNVAMGISPERDYELYQAFHNGELAYEAWMHTLESEYRSGVSRAEVTNSLTTYTLREGAAASVATAKEWGMTTAIITGGFYITARHLADTLGVDHVKANTHCIFADDQSHTITTNQSSNPNVAQYFTNLDSGGEEEATKIQMLHQLCAELRLTPADCIAVGDGANDIGLFTETYYGVTFTNAEPAVHAAAQYSIESLTELPELLRRLQ